MPHSTRRRKELPAHSKRTLVDSGDGWTYVVKTSRDHKTLKRLKAEVPERGLPFPEQTYESEAGDAVTDSEHQRIRPAVIAVGTTLDTLVMRYDKIRKAWKETACAKNLRKVLHDALDIDLGMPKGLEIEDDAGIEQDSDRQGQRSVMIKRAVCFGLGSLSSEMQSGTGTSMWQLVAYLDMCREIIPTPALPIYVQDPAFNELDLAFLTSHLHLKVLRNPEAQDRYMDPSTLVYAPHLGGSTYAAILSGKPETPDSMPHIVIGNSVEQFIEQAQIGMHRTPHPVVEAGARFLMGRRSVAFPVCQEQPTAFNHTTIYWLEMKDGK